MAQIFGVIGFFIGLLAILFASEVMRRSAEHQTKTQAELFKMQMHIKDLENKVHRVDRATTETHHQKARQAETLTALAAKGEAETPPKAPRRTHQSGSGSRFTPYSAKQHKTG